MHTRKKGLRDPNCFRAIAICDPHFAASSPPAFKVDYLEYVTSNVSQVLKHAGKIKADAILWAGDMFHLKEPRNNPHWLVSKVIGLLAEADQIYGCPSLGIGGNHDYKHGCLEAGLHGSPLDTLIQAGIYHLLDREEWLFENDKGDISVRVAGGSYHHSQAQHVRDKKKLEAKHLIALGHFWLGKQTGEFFGEPLYGFDFFQESEVDTFIVGHHHEDKGVMDVGDKQYISHGSISITGAHPHDLQRRPGAALIEITPQGRTTKILRPKGPTAADLIDLDHHKQIKEEKKEMDDFIERLSTTVLTASDPEAVLKELAASEEIRERASEYISAAEAAE